MGWVTTIKVHRCGDPVLCRQTKTLSGICLTVAVMSCSLLWGALCPPSGLTLVCVESADAGVFLCWVPQFHRAVGRAGQEAVLNAAVSQSPHAVRMPRPRPCQDAGI